MKHLLLALLLLASPAQAQNTFFAGSPGDMIYRGVTGWQAVPGGTAGQILQSNGPTAAPTWSNGFGTYTTFPFVLPAIPTNRVLGNASGVNAAPSAITQSQFLDTIGYDTLRPPATGAMVYKDGTTGTWQATTGQPNVSYVMTMQASGVPAWQSGPSSALIGLCSTSGAFPIYNATTAAWVCSTVGGTGSTVTLSGGPLTINTTAQTTTSGLTLTGSLPVTGSNPGSQIYLNSLTYGQDNYDVGTSGNVYGLLVNLNYGGSNTRGQRIAVLGLVTLNTLSTLGSAGAVGVTGEGNAVANNGGTGLGAGTSLGGVFGANFLCQLSGTATNYNTCTGVESDARIESGASAYTRVAYSAVGYGQNAGAKQGAGIDAAYAIWATANDPGFKNAIYLSNNGGGTPIGTNGCIICSDGTSWNITTGIDLSNGLTISGNAWASPGITISGALGVVTQTIALSANISGDGVVLQNTTAATSGNQRYSPRLRLTGQGWKTNATAASQQLDWVVENRPVQAAAAPVTSLVFATATNGGGYSDRFTIQDLGSSSGTSANTNGQTFSAFATYVNGTNIGSFYSDATQVIVGGVTAVPVKFITNNSTKMTLSNAGGLSLNTSVDPGLGSIILNSASSTSLSLYIGGSNTASFYADATQTIIGSVANTLVKFITNNTAKLTLSAVGGLSVGAAADPGAGAIATDASIVSGTTITAGTGLTVTTGDATFAAGNLVMGTAAKTLLLKRGANGAVGTFTCTSGGTITVSNTNVAITDTIIISMNTVNVIGSATPYVSAITAATSFVAKCTTNDTSVYNYAIIKNAA